jgi:hypothetical protein
MRSIAAVGALLGFFLVGCGPSYEEQAAESFGLFARKWTAATYPGEVVTKETTQEFARGEDSTYDVVKAFYRRQTVFEGLRTHVITPAQPDLPYLGVLRGQRIVRSTATHATVEAAEQDATFTGACFTYPEEYVFEFVGGDWRPREDRTASAARPRR